MKTCVIIPAFNEAQTIGSIVKELRARELDVLVIDDGSIDKTAEIAEKLGAVVLRNTTNLGKGRSLSKGFDYALQNDFQAVITMDADGQHSPEEIPSFLKSADDTSSQIVVGNRMQERRNMPFIRVLTNKFMSWLISNIAKQRIPDTQCGFRLIKQEVLKNLCLKTCKFEIETEILLDAAQKGYRITSTPIKSIYSQEHSHINPFVDTIRFFRYLLSRK